MKIKLVYTNIDIDQLTQKSLVNFKMSYENCQCLRTSLMLINNMEMAKRTLEHLAFLLKFREEVVLILCIGLTKSTILPSKQMINMEKSKIEQELLMTQRMLANNDLTREEVKAERKNLVELQCQIKRSKHLINYSILQPLVCYSCCILFSNS